MSILTTVPADQVVSVSRDIPAPREQVWGAFTDPLRLAGWYGPEGWHVPVHTISMDLRPGGMLRLAMVQRGQAGAPMPLYSTYVSVVPHELIEHRESLPGPGGEQTDAQVLHRIELLEREVEGRPGTRVVISQGPLPEVVHDQVSSGWGTALDKLHHALAQENRTH